MNRIMILATAVLVVVAGMSISQEANAGLFNRDDCCKPQKCRQGLFSKLKAKRAAKDCCAPEPCCGAPEPTCCDAAPVCAAPVYAAPVASCGCSAPVVEAAPACGCAAAPAPSCGCEVASCGCEAAPSCGCETASCDCLSRRKLRRANRGGECCDAVANTCNTCGDAGIQTVSYNAPVYSAAPAVEGCSTCGGGEFVGSYESAPAVEGCSTCGGGESTAYTESSAPVVEEAAPEAPEAK